MILIIHQDKIVWRFARFNPDGSPGEIDAEEALARAARATGLAEAELEAWSVPAAQVEDILHLPLDQLLVQRDAEGRISSVSPAPALWLHVSLSGGDGDPFMLGILNDGVSSLSVDVALRFGPQATDPVVPLTGDWRITVRDDKDRVYDIVKVGLVDGVTSFNYTTTGPPAQCHLDDKDLQVMRIPVDGVDYLVKLANPVQFKVYRSV